MIVVSWFHDLDPSYLNFKIKPTTTKKANQKSQAYTSFSYHFQPFSTHIICGQGTNIVFTISYLFMRTKEQWEPTAVGSGRTHIVYVEISKAEKQIRRETNPVWIWFGERHLQCNILGHSFSVTAYVSIWIGLQGIWIGLYGISFLAALKRPVLTLKCWMPKLKWNSHK